MKKLTIDKYNQIKAIAFPGRPPTRDSNIPELREVAEMASWIGYDVDPLMMAIHQAEEKLGLSLSTILLIVDRKQVAKKLDAALGGTLFSDRLDREINQLHQLHLIDSIGEFLEATGTIGDFYLDLDPHPSSTGYLAQIMTEDGRANNFGDGSEIFEAHAPTRIEVLLEFVMENQIPVPDCQLTEELTYIG
jgi:hypothetical protein